MGGMEPRLRCDDALLILGGEEIAVEVDLGLVLPGRGFWGGVLRRIPASLAAEVQTADEVRLRLSNGQERRIRPLTGRGDSLSAVFLGEGGCAVLMHRRPASL
ncbi:hypothetical protein ACF1AY_35055 [Streptomyces sp. NPDC014776]|uniref:hypothetical protein n=1 Tax=unclassified Streptomyces TaxID=2593676 RepID=UPI0036F84814